MAKKVTGFDTKFIDELIKNYKEPEDILGEGGLLKQLKKAILERVLEGELTTPLGYDRHDPRGNNSGNSRNGHSAKTLKQEDGDLKIQIPRDRNSEFEPQIISKHQTRFNGFDDKIISLYSRGMTTRDIQAQLQELYGVEVSPTLISNVTNEVLEEVIFPRFDRHAHANILV